MQAVAKWILNTLVLNPFKLEYSHFDLFRAFAESKELQA